ncbi:MAG: hypothetical protein H0T47_03635 [Planctomycetaceae bacterium]|nr:hypothetical protein [Planctomycetaceae bacterium]
MYNDQSAYPFESATYDVEPGGDRLRERRHTGFGIASFVLAILSGIAMLALFVVAGIMETATPEGLDEESIEAMAVGLGFFGFAMATLLAFVLGVAGLFQSNRNKTFAILGMLFSILTLLGTTGLITVGLMME